MKVTCWLKMLRPHPPKCLEESKYKIEIADIRPSKEKLRHRSITRLLELGNS